MIVKMKFINISGPRDDIDRVTDLYLSRYEIQLESALSELKIFARSLNLIHTGMCLPRQLSSSVIFRM